MRKSFVTLLLLFGAAVFMTNLAFAQQPEQQAELGNKLQNAKIVKALMSRATRLGSNSSFSPDTTFVGHSYDASHASSTANYWNLYVGDYTPGTSSSTNAFWDFDNEAGYAPYNPDTLQGWWPMRRLYNITGGITLPDKSRPWWAIDMGNQVNYVMNQGAGNKRTKGVVGVWHRDQGSGAAGGSAVTWAPLAGSASAWCGLRQHGDVSTIDAAGFGGEDNPFNQVAAEFNGIGPTAGTGTNKGYPGYGSQWDQMLFIDQDLGTTNRTTAVPFSFLYSTRMSTVGNTAPATITGHFYKDPLSLAAGNFISASDAASEPVDSFQVYIGAPVIDTACVYSNSATPKKVYDKRHRWFSEVLRVNEASIPWSEVFAAAGSTDSTLAGGVSTSPTLDTARVNPILRATGGKLRLVFRVKTNRGQDDDGSGLSGFNSRGRGAAIIDNVSFNGTTIGSFETPSGGGTFSIDNRVEGTNTLNWRSTGKAPPLYFHPHDVASLPYAELCGPYNSPNRFCNIGGMVISAGDHDNGEAAGGPTSNPAERERMDGMVSPTINLGGSNLAHTANAQGITGAMTDVSEDYYVFYDLYAGVFNLFFTGNAWTYGFQSYPSKQRQNGAVCWGEISVPGFQIFNPDPQCFTDFEPGFAFGLIPTANATTVPDSIRLFLGKNQQCFRFKVSLGCSPTDGCYFDNVALGMVNPAAQANAVSPPTPGVDIWRWINDSFPRNESITPGTTDFDTCAAILQTGINTAQSTNNELRFDIPGDSTLVSAGTPTDTVRVDLVWRCKPGVGNYVTVGNSASGVRGIPTSAAPAGAGSFFGAYMANNGRFGTGGSGTIGVGESGPGHPGGVWNKDRWNSTRCDTSEVNIFPASANGINFPGIVGGNFAAIMHEDDPHFGTLGLSKNRCFLTSPTATSATSASVVCAGGTFLGAYPPAWVTSGAGYNGSSTTTEYTKVFRDMEFTPGTSVEYFFRISSLGAGSDPDNDYKMIPDTNFVLPQGGEGSTDGHRWQSFFVLPDRWKDPSFSSATAGGVASACMLVVDLNDRRGNERAWVSAADSIGATASAKFGAHNGWHAPGGTNPFNGVSVADDPSFAVFTNGGQPGTTWDIYNVKASESITTSCGALGGRLANLPPAGQAATGKSSKQGPTPAMLRNYYRMLLILTGDLNSGILGPFVNRSQDDISLLNDYLANSSPAATQPRGIMVEGDGFVQGEMATGTGTEFSQHAAFLSEKLGVTLVDPSYQNDSQINAAFPAITCVDLNTTTDISALGDVYGVGTTCLWSDDVVGTNSVGVPEAVAGSYYQNLGPNGPYIAGVYKPSTVSRPWIAVTDGWDIEHIYNRYCDNSVGRVAYLYNTLNNVFGTICALVGTPAITLDTPQNHNGSAFANFMKLRNNPYAKGMAEVRFGLARGDRVTVKIYDVTGRLVRTLADRNFPAGEHTLTWDGSSDAGQQVARGVYFTQVKFLNSKFADAKKLTVLK